MRETINKLTRSLLICMVGLGVLSICTVMITADISLFALTVTLLVDALAPLGIVLLYVLDRRQPS
jgi:hypothetical protein